MDLDGLVEPATLERARRAAAGEDVSRPLRLGAAEPGEVGVLRGTVVHVEAPRTFRRRNGSEGLLARVRLGDGTGEADLVLWDDETRHVRDGAFAPGASVVLRGVQVRAGYRGGIELGLGAASVETAPQGSVVTISGVVETIGDTEPVDGRFRAEIELATDDGIVMAVVWDEAVKAVRAAGLGADIALAGVTAHPLLDGCYLADGATVRVLKANSAAANNQPPTTSDG